MPIVLETGTGNAAANSWATVAELDAFAADRGLSLGAGDREVALIRAADYLRNEQKLKYRGSRATAVQSLPWPRTAVSLRDGPALPDNTIPGQLRLAQCALAALVLINNTTLLPTLANGGLAVQSRTVDVLSTSYFQPAPGQPAPTADPLFTEAMAFLSPLLRDAAVDTIAPVIQFNDWTGTPFQ